MYKHLGASALGAVVVLVAASTMAQSCPGDLNGNERVSIDELVTSVNSALNGCPAPEERFVDNGDGTISDNLTGLMWEKKVALDESPVICTTAASCPNPNDADNQYTWSIGPPWEPDGTAFTVFLTMLNGQAFANRADWRLPTLEELQGIVDDSAGGSLLIDPLFDNDCQPGCGLTECSCTVADFYWSSTSLAGSLGQAWGVFFFNGFVLGVEKPSNFHVRAVRGGS